MSERNKYFANQAQSRTVSLFPIKENSLNIEKIVRERNQYRRGYYEGAMWYESEFLSKACQWLMAHRCDWDESVEANKIAVEEFQKWMTNYGT